MSGAEIAARRYIDAWFEPDHDRRAALLEMCFAVDGRLSVLGKALRSRAELAAAIDAFQVDPRKLVAAMTSAIEAGATSFRFRARFSFSDGRLHSELVDVGEIGGDGRIAALYTFADPLGDPDPGGLRADAPLVAQVAQRYVDVLAERDPAARRAALDACFATDARFVTLRRTLRGPAEIAAMIDRALGDPRGFSTRLTTAIEAAGASFRFGAIAEFADGSPGAPVEDAGEIDGDGRIAVLYTFPGPLPTLQATRS
jgi:hypothetical protein